MRVSNFFTKEKKARGGLGAHNSVFVVGLSSVLYWGTRLPHSWLLLGHRIAMALLVVPPHLSITLYTDGRVWLRSLVSQYPIQTQRRGKRDPASQRQLFPFKQPGPVRRRKSSEYDIYTTCNKNRNKIIYTYLLPYLTNNCIAGKNNTELISKVPVIGPYWW